MPPTTAPGIEPKPPITAAVKPLMTMSPIVEDRNTTGATSTPATAPTTPASTHDVEYTRSTLIPISRAARWFCATARIARPSRVNRNSAQRAAIRASEPPRIPSETGATRAGPTTRGADGKNDGNGNSSWVHASPAAARRISESPTVMMSTSQWVPAIARRMIARSTSHARAPPARMATTSVSTRGSPSARCADHATNVDIISISPCAKFSVRVAL